eukprot:3662740-Pyramimonas_sp.AAC.1
MGNRTKRKDNTKCHLATRLRSYTRARGKSGAGRAVGRRGNAVRVVEGRGSCRWPQRQERPRQCTWGIAR